MLKENTTREIESGVLQFGPVSEAQENRDLRLFVHPYYRDGSFESKLQCYATNRDKLIKREPTPQILIVDEKDLPATVKRYRKPLFSDYRVIFLARKNHPDPLNGSWEGLKEFIRENIKPKKVLLSGAMLFLNRINGEYTPSEECGCVGYTYSKLKEFDPEIQVENCFVLK